MGPSGLVHGNSDNSDTVSAYLQLGRLMCQWFSSPNLVCWTLEHRGRTLSLPFDPAQTHLQLCPLQKYTRAAKKVAQGSGGPASLLSFAATAVFTWWNLTGLGPPSRKEFWEM